MAPDTHRTGVSLCRFIVWLYISAVISFLSPFIDSRIALAAQKGNTRVPVKVIYLPLADHYAGIVAYERYRDQMTEAELILEQLKGPHLIPFRFRDDDVDMAFTISSQAMAMFIERQDFQWVSLLHRDGMALAVNEIIKTHTNLTEDRKRRKPDYKIAEAFKAAKNRSGEPVECSVPLLQSTHTVALYKYLRDHGMTLGFRGERDKDVIVVEVPPPLSPSFIKKKNSRSLPAAFVQSMPWGDIVETQGFGYVAWYSKDIIPWPKGHVECIAIAKKKSIENKEKALREVIYYLHKAGLDIEAARRNGGRDLIAVTAQIHKHIPEHNQDAIIQSLRPDLNIINYFNLNIDTAGLKQIMDYAVQGGILEKPIDIELFANPIFSTRITEH